jgi:hypothetical protein
VGTQVDFSLGMAVETAYGVPVVVSRFFESPVKWQYKPVKVQGKGMRPTKVVDRLNRNTLARIEVTGEQEVEIGTKGFGLLLQAALGSVTNTLIKVGLTAYQQVHTLTLTDPVNSYTVQGVLPFLGGGAANPHTFTGCVVDGITLEAKEGEILTAKLDWLGRDMVTNIAAAAASYPVSELFTFVHGTISTGTITPPTATSLAFAGVTIANVSEFSLSIKNGLDKGGYNLGGAGKRTRKNEIGPRKISGKIKAEYTDNTLRDAYINQTPLGLVLTFQYTAGGSLGTDGIGDPVYPTLQIVLPAILTKGDIPASDGGSPISLDIDFDAFDNGSAAQAIWIVYRTTDVTP